ncbi:MAG: hypothetical protein LUE29_09860, partial [Lachnospiraceae bacterium]|nr:hypothetical protein [Lachnospiraceae bacterium]
NLPERSSIIDWITGSGNMSLSKFGEELANFGPYLKAYSDSVVGVKAETVKNSASAAEALSEMAKNFPERNSVIGWITGSDNMSLSKFGEELAEFGPHLKKYSDSLDGLSSSLIEESATAAKVLFDMADNLPDQNGIVDWVTGGTMSLSDFGKELFDFGPYLKKYADSVDGMPVDAATNSATAATALAAVAEALPEQSSKVQSWFGDGSTLSLSEFGAELEAFGPSLKEYADSVDGMPVDAATNSAAAALALAAVADALPVQSDGVKSWFNGSTLTLSAFGAE